MSNIPFRIARGEEVSILNKPFMEGCVYFATDTKRIYMDTYVNGIEQNKMAMGGGNSGIFYAHKGFEDSSDVSFLLSDIEGDELPSINDLIVNYKSSNELRDGFYKVIAVDIAANRVETEYLPVGGGGGTGSGTGPSGGGKLLIKPETASTGMTTLERGYVIKYAIEAYNNAGAPITTAGRATFIINGVSVDGGPVNHGGIYEFPVTKYLSTIKEMNTITLKVSMNTGGVVDDIQTYTWTVKCVNLQLTWDWVYNTANYIKEESFTLSWKVKGGVQCFTHIMVDDKTDDDHYFIVPVAAGQTEVSKTLSSFAYGVHKFTMWATATVDSIDLDTEPVSHMLTFIGGSSTTPILTVPYYDGVTTQYDTIRIPFLIYQPNVEKLDITFYVDNVEVLTQSYETTSTSLHYWPYTLGRPGEVKLKLVCTKYPAIEHVITLQVKPLDLGISEPTAGLAFSLKASDISGNAQLKQLESEGKINFSSNFDWTNGGLKSETDENGNVSNYICVRQGTNMTLNYNLFGSQQTNTQGKTFKFCFKAVNCYEYDAPVLECYEETTKLGLKFNAQQALFSTSANANFTTQYCEGSYIELETEIWPNQMDNGNRPGDRFLMFWVDGVPAGIQTYSDASFTQNVPKKIVIGSDKCDVYVYVAKVYETKLSALDHLNNFILDAPNVNEILSRFNRNNILGSNNEISYEKLVKNNPGCHAYLYKLTANGMTTNKEDEKPCDYTEYYMNSEKPCLTAENAKIMVQGTSSAAYGVAAFNVRTDFGDTTMYDGDGNEVEGRKVSDSSIPVDFTCTKVNVASCENANNALNAEWYDRFQPYYDGHRRKSTATKKYRDCMEFDFGVMFIEDHNKNTNFLNADGKPDKAAYTSTNVFGYDLEGNQDREYVNNPYYKQYAVANMGNDKKNRSVFHDTKNYKACCVEVLDNQNAAHWMTKKVNIDDFVWGDDDTGGFYEFRYSVDKYKGNEALPNNMTKGEYEKVQAQSFIDFVNWMASCDPRPYDADSHPNGYTGAALSQSVTYGPKTFTGFIPEGWDDETSSGVSLAGFTTSKYAKTYTHDTEEYRIAKMLNECEDHLVMDSVVYHYLFIQRHTMVDNVAKNTFWSTEDLQHWDLTKNYDNDTSDGNDNSGYLRYGYGKEIMDKREDGADVFNASDSVWLNFIYNIPDVQEDLYKKLQNRKIDGVQVWDSNSYLKLFKEKQSLIPERCWIEDYFRKYIRPRRLGLDGDNSFIQRLEGGKKTHQRQQYETYQGYYIDSKYCSGTSFNDTGSFDMRLNKGPAIYKLTDDTVVVEGKNYFEKKVIADSGTDVEDLTTWEDYVKVNIIDTNINPHEKGYYEITSGGWTKNEKFPTTYYIDLYPSAHIGGQKWRKPTRLKRGQSVDIPVGELLDAPTDATCYIYAANMIQTIGGISNTYPNYMGVSSASKLRELEAGSNAEGYFNDKLNNAVLNQNTQLEKAQLQQVGSDKLSGLDLSNLTMLKELKIDMKSKFPTLKLAKGGIIHTLYLNEHLNTLNVKELHQLQAYNSETGKGFKYDAGIFDNLTSILIQNCPVMNDFGYQIVKTNKLTKYCFNDIEWTVPSSDIDFTNGKILVLENLLEKDGAGNKLKSYVEVTSQALALTGKLKIDLTTVSDKKLDEYSVYARYKKEFPNLQIEYIGSNANNLTPAHTIAFYNDVIYTLTEDILAVENKSYYSKTITADGEENYSKVTINTEDSPKEKGYYEAKYYNLIYSVKTNGQQTLSTLISENGPNGIALGVPEKESDKVYDYQWNEKWKDGASDIIYPHSSILTMTPTLDINFIAQYNKTKHQYTITLKDGNVEIEHNFGTRTYGENITADMPYYLYRAHESAELRYEFQGWISARDYLSGKDNVNIITEFIVEGDTTYYAHYVEKNKTQASRNEYFYFEDSGKTICLKNIYRDVIQEPIVLPIMNGTTPITTIGNFGYYNQTSSATNKIPAIYFENNGANSAYTTIETGAFWSGELSGDNSKLLLKTIILPETITTIGSYAFEGCKFLETINLPTVSESTGLLSIGSFAFANTGKIRITKGSLNKLEEIGVSAFNKAGPYVEIEEIPNLSKIASYAFAKCENVAIEDFSNVTQVDSRAFIECGQHKQINIILPTVLNGFSNNCFAEYAINNILTVTYPGNEPVEAEVLSRLGLTASDPTTIEQVFN